MTRCGSPSVHAGTSVRDRSSPPVLVRTGGPRPVLHHQSGPTAGVMWPGPGRGVNGRVLGEMARHRPVSPCPAPRAQRCMQAGGVHSVLAMRAKARTSARRMPGFACDWSANARPRIEARACATHGRERAQLATRIADWSIQQRLSLHGQETGGGARSRLGRGGGRGTAARARNRPFSAPHARNGVGIGSGAKCC